MAKSPSLVLVLAGATLPLSRIHAQNDAVRCQPEVLVVKTVENATSGPDIPAPPRVVLPLPAHTSPPVPIGAPNGLAEPATPPSAVTDPTGLPASGQFTFFRNSVVRPAGASIDANTVEPSGTTHSSVWFQTGNFYAALSRDQGSTWTHVNPYTFFPAIDGGFCCDQRVEHVPSHDLTVWTLQYGFSATTGRGSYRIAWAPSFSAIRAGLATGWRSVTYSPQDFGFAADTWFDFPDISHAGAWLQVSANVQDAASNRAGSVKWRMSLDDMRAGTTVQAFYQNSSMLGGGFSYHFANAGDGSAMFFASLNSTTGVRIWRQDLATGTTDHVDRGVASWSNAAPDCPAPDGSQWMRDNISNKMRGSCGTPGEIIFFWTAAQNGGSRPRPYTRVSRFRASDRTLIAEHDVWNATTCFGYATAEGSILSHIGGVLAYAGGGSYPNAAAWLIDSYSSWTSGLSLYAFTFGARSPTNPRWGDYLDVQRNSLDPRTFVATGFAIHSDGITYPRQAWFGRDDYTPLNVPLSVTSTPPSGVAITLDVTDLTNQTGGTTPFTRTYHQGQHYKATAPLFVLATNPIMVFSHWVWNSLAQPVGQRDFETGIGNAADTLQAVYTLRHRVTFADNLPAATAAITINVLDLNGNAGGNTGFVRDYRDGTLVDFTAAPTASNGAPFQRWNINGQAQTLGVRTLQWRILSADTLSVEYGTHTAGALTPFGAGCAGSGGIDVHSVQGTPELNQWVAYRLGGGPGASVAILVMGFSRTNWQGIPLPLVLGASAPGCSILVSFDATFGVAVNPRGDAVIPMTLANDPSLIGGHLFTQYLCVDPGANPAGITLSNGVDMRFGGIR
jgi:hypothetical protein